MIYIPILNNISLLITLSIANLLLIKLLKKGSWAFKISGGILFGLVTIVGMFNSIELTQGLFFDGRSIILAVAGVFGGPVMAVIAATMAASFRLWIGGPGTIMGVSVIAMAATLGTCIYFIRKRYNHISPPLLYFILGFLVHLIMLVMINLIPREFKSETFLIMLFPILFIYPLATFLVCLIFHQQETQYATMQKLSESEERFRQLFYNNQAVFLLFDPYSYQIADANFAAQNFYGWTIEELRKKKITDLNTLEQNVLDQKIKDALDHRQNQFQFDHKLSSGEIKHVEVFAGPVKINGIKYLYSVVHDITHRKIAEQRLIQSERSYRGLFNAVKDAIYIQDENGLFLDVNEGAEKMYGYPKESFFGQSPEFLSAPDINDPEELKHRFSQAFEGKPVSFEYWGKRANGEVFPKLVKLYKGFYFEQDVIIAIAQDITAQKNSEKVIRDAQENLQALINVIDQIFLLLDCEGNILICNKTFEKLYQDKVPLIGRNVFDLIPQETNYLRQKYFKAVLEKRQPVDFEDSTQNGNWWNYYYPLVNKSGNVERIAVYATDITHQKKMLKLESDLKIAEKSADLKQRFLANMSHEMRTPMNGIIGMTEMLAKTNLDFQQQDFVNTIKESSHSLLSLINDILDLSRFESGNMTLNLTPVSLLDIQTRIKNLFATNMKSKNLRFTIDFAPDMPEYILSDEKRIMQIFINLLGNSLKFTREGSIMLKAEMLSGNGDFRNLKFTIHDTGIGIDQKFLPKVFDEFAQYDESSTRQYEGTGLGLAICKKNAAMLGGEIGVSSIKGIGSKFWFTIKAQTTSAPKLPGNNLPLKPYEKLGLKVLLVEDKQINIKVARLILLNFGCTVEVAENGLIAIEMISYNRYDVILMDIQMPVMDGVTTVRNLKSMKIKLPYIIGLSAEAMEGDAEKYIAEGMDDYITKPLIPGILHQKLSNVKKSIV